MGSKYGIFFDFLESVARSDVLGAISIESLYAECEYSFDLGRVGIFLELLGKLRSLFSELNAGMRPDFEALLFWVVHEEEADSFEDPRYWPIAPFGDGLQIIGKRDGLLCSRVILNLKVAFQR